MEISPSARNQPGEERPIPEEVPAHGPGHSLTEQQMGEKEQELQEKEQYEIHMAEQQRQKELEEEQFLIDEQEREIALENERAENEARDKEKQRRLDQEQQNSQWITFDPQTSGGIGDETRKREFNKAQRQRFNDKERCRGKDQKEYDRIANEMRIYQEQHDHLERLRLASKEGWEEMTAVETIRNEAYRKQHVNECFSPSNPTP